jgi:nitrogen fixation protein FixH
MDWERRANDDPEDSFYVDFGLTLNNTVAATLTVPAGATVARASNVSFVAGSAVFAAGDVGRQIHFRHSTTDTEGVVTYSTSKATITSFNSTTNVLCTIDAAFPAAAVIASGAWRLSVTTISGLGHLEGQTVDVLADGASHPQRTVSGGAIALQQPSSKVHVGLGFPTKLQTMRLNAGAQDGTTQGKKARVNRCVVRLLETGSLRYGADFTTLYDVNLRTALMPMDSPPSIFSGDVIIDWPGEYSTNPWLCFTVEQPMPATIIALMPQISASEQG